MKTRFPFFLMLVMFLYQYAICQNIEPAPPDKAVVYFVRTVKGAFFLSVANVFHEKSPIGFLTYRNFMRFECEPGINMFWVMTNYMSQNTFTYYKQFVDADLLAGKIYLIEIRMQLEGIRMEPVAPSIDIERMNRIKSVLNSKSSIKANKMLEKKKYGRDRIHKSWAKKGMNKYPKFDEKDKVRQLLPDWFVQPEELILPKKDKRKKVET